MKPFQEYLEIPKVKEERIYFGTNEAGENKQFEYRYDAKKFANFNYDNVSFICINQEEVDNDKPASVKWEHDLFAQYPDLTKEQFNSFCSRANNIFNDIDNEFEFYDLLFDTVTEFVRKFFEPPKTSNS
jgi:hypothetical protein